MNEDEFIEKLLRNDAKVPLNEVIKLFVVTLGLLDKKSPSCKRMKALDDKNYNAFINTFSLTFTSNLYISTLDEDEAVEFAKKMSEADFIQNVSMLTMKMKRKVEA